MFVRAVGEHKKTTTAKPSAGLAQQPFPSSSPTAPAKTAATAYAVSKEPSRHGAGAERHHRPSILKPIAPSGLNTPGMTSRKQGTSFPKQVYSQPDLAISGPSSQEAYPPPVVRDSGGSLNGSSQVHSAVYFNENDFDDDAELELTIENPMLKGFVAQPSQQIQSLPDQYAGKASQANEPPASASSVPLPWSSSPQERRIAPVKPAPSLPTRGSPRSQRPPADNGNGVYEDDDRRPKKPRPLFWKDSNASQTNSGNSIRGANGRQYGGEGPSASAGKAKKSPWNNTASGLKEEQKRVKQKKPQTSRGEKASEVAGAVSSKKTKSVGGIFLSDEQKAVSNLVVKEGNSVFFTGSAGTGKSVLLRQIIAGLQTKYKHEPDRVAVTASTGLAACNIGGVTLHSFSGIGLGKEPAKDLIKKIKKNAKARSRWMRTKVLIIDEISMVDGDLFDKLEEVARVIRNTGKPFGGIQLIITGDFFQLPPVPDNGRLARFAFEAATWATAIQYTIGLTQVFRQKDPVFAGMLNEMRLGRLSQKSIETFRSLSRPIQYGDDLDATELFPTRAEVDGSNNTRMRHLHGESVAFEARDAGTITDRTQRDKLLSNCMAPPCLSLKLGAQVMLIKNLDESLVNGSLGKVVGFMDEKEFEIFQRNETDYETYEATGPDHEQLLQLRKLKAKDSDSGRGGGLKLPYVRFTNTDGTSRNILVQPETWKIELPNGEVQASRTQVPLILAWALSIHKAQGQTLERVKVDLGRVFEKGQAYVALSRATCQEGLQVLRFDPAKVMAHEKVRQFYNSLYGSDGLDASSKLPAHGASQTRPIDLDDEEAMQDFEDDDLNYSWA